MKDKIPLIKRLMNEWIIFSEEFCSNEKEGSLLTFSFLATVDQFYEIFDLQKLTTELTTALQKCKEADQKNEQLQLENNQNRSFHQ